jgi:la-related protein 1
MYQEFRQLAFDDARDRDSFIGLHNLIAFYDESILSSRVISDEVARDYVDLVRSEMGKPDKPAFARLRAALRNGALPLKNRVKVDKLLDSELKKDLER